ncbi:DUF6624 domain-containing protein [Caulobacter sp.]|uniref:DUF6624 domain-containing protein n=1 Tax=Caulobacter sp. TaxID=78 RepID=UPI0025C7294B|nr:DUF6624 domain-containing protein [Caulobacter sp.]
MLFAIARNSSRPDGRNRVLRLALKVVTVSLLVVGLATFPSAPRAQFTARNLTAQDLGIRDVSEQELEALRAYPIASNALRAELAAALSAPDGEERAREIARINQEILKLDETMRSVAIRLVRGGFWLRTKNRDIALDAAIFGVIQHIFDPELVLTSLAQMPPLVERRLIPGDFYALMFDRQAMQEGRPQRFGSQFDCRDGRLVLYSLEDPAGVDARRAQLGMTQTSVQYAEPFLGKRCK